MIKLLFTFSSSDFQDGFQSFSQDAGIRPDFILDSETTALPFGTSTVSEIKCNFFLERCVLNIPFVLEEMYRVLVPEGTLSANVKIFNSASHLNSVPILRPVVPETLVPFGFSIVSFSVLSSENKDSLKFDDSIGVHINNVTTSISSIVWKAIK